MESIAVFVNDLTAARHILQPMLRETDRTHWILVACPPTLTRHAGRWVSHQARRQWQERWAADLFSALKPELQAHPENTVETLVPRRPLADESTRLLARLPHLRLLDARQSRLGRIDEPISHAQPAAASRGWAAPATVTASLTMVLALSD